MTRRLQPFTGATIAAAQAVAASVEIPAEWSPPSVLPPQWKQIDRLADGAQYIDRAAGLAVFVSCCVELDGRAWIHFSISHRARLPRWSEVVEAKELFLGNREAYQVIPPKERYVNLHPNVLHLFALLDETAAALPDFTHGTGSL